jgi:AraC-like DNA-binding protein
MQSPAVRCRGPYGDYEDRIRDTYLGLDIDEIDVYRPFEAEFRSRWVGDVCMTCSRTLNATGGISWIRSKDRIERDAEHFMILMMVRDGEVSHTQYGVTTKLTPGGLTLIDSREAYRVQRIGPAASFNVRMPLDLVKAALPAPERYCGMAIDARSGLNAIMMNLLMAIWRHAEDPDLPSVDELCVRILDAATTIFQSARSRTIFVPAPRVQHYDRAIRFVDAHLSDTDLHPSRIASALRISTGHLHAVMRSRGTSIGKLIIDRRLDRSRADLLNPELRTRTIAQVAMNWGFSDYAHFSKTFKKRYGLSPRKFRVSPGLAATVQSPDAKS